MATEVKSEEEKLQNSHRLIENEEEEEEPPKYPTIISAEIAGGYFNKHVAFIIKTPSNVDIKRRYSDFEWLRQWLCTLFPGAFIPPIPPKLAIAMWPPGYLTTRSRELQHFLQRIDMIPYLKEEEVTNLFLNNVENSSFDKARKKFEKETLKPCEKAQYEKLKEIFPKIHQTQMPQDMDLRCEESTKLINESIKYLDIMITSSEAFIKHATECNVALNEFQKDFENLLQIEYADSIDIEKRIDICPYFEEWHVFKSDEIKQMNVFFVPTLHRALNDLKVIQQILLLRDKLQSEHELAKKKADVYDNDDDEDEESKKSDLENEIGANECNENEENKFEDDEDVEEEVKEEEKESDFKNLIGKLVDTKTKELAKREKEIEREIDLRNLKEFVEKLVLGQLNVIFSANTRRWKKSCDIFAEKHISSLEKMCESWKDLEYAILLTKDERYQRLEKRFMVAKPIKVIEKKEQEKEPQSPSVAQQDDFMDVAKSLFSNARNYFMSSSNAQK